MDATPKTLVMKFGGTSVGTSDAMRQVVNIIRETYRLWPRQVVITSALSGVTDLLVNGAINAARGDMAPFYRAENELHERHHILADALVTDLARQNQVKQEIDFLIADFANLCQAIRVLGEASPRALDAVSGLGERLSVRILAAAVESIQLPSQFIESTQLIITDDHFQNALPDMEVTTQCSRRLLEPILDRQHIPIVTGFIGATANGIPTTLGRGGSDYTASILGVALGAAEVWIWTDVDGVMTADPRLVPEARTIPVLSYREVAEMAYYGAKVLHPKCIHPVIEAGIGLRVCNTFNPSNPGTRLVIEREVNPSSTLKAVTAIRNLQLVTVVGRGMLGVPGVAGRIFSAVATTGISVPLIIESTSEQSICFAAPKESIPQVIRALHANLSQEFQRHDIDQAYASEEVDIITVISPGLRRTPGIAGRIFSVLGNAGINILAISYGASDVSLNLVVSAEDTRSAINLLHGLIIVGD